MTEPIPDDDDLARARARMVQSQLVPRGIRDPRVLAAMERVPRELFVPPSRRARAYEDVALPLEEGQTISQPYMVARSCEALGLRGDERVLEIGGGSGYQAAVLAELGREVVTVEILPSLAESARRNLAAAGLGDRVRVVAGDGVAVAGAEGPFDRIVVAAGADQVPQELLDALVPDGIVVAPVGTRFEQRLMRIRKDRDGFIEVERLDPCVFVPLTRSTSPS